MPGVTKYLISVQILTGFRTIGFKLIGTFKINYADLISRFNRG